MNIRATDSDHRDTLHRAFELRLASGYRQLADGAFAAALTDFEAAHILGQTQTLPHLRSHIALLRWGWRSRSAREMGGQIGRLLGAALFTWLWVPRGNPGSTRVGAFTPQPSAEDLARLLEGHRS